MNSTEKVEILYNPYQGLKLFPRYPNLLISIQQVEILYNPYQGLKPDP
ncbi:hypothetical protein MC7420_862 [Coleofasciculus chthonoplastes PCC 7420]|uniref:Uncharacterized protein n=1 Tax=Coleofasciculus chthonoplastes PCC 7420 TaxID=118168 RepID=B4VST2_9CYAN|nr:hypothetical protein MC7420_862 [Coleofasciculus chthonoplastes PCC 7420]